MTPRYYQAEAIEKCCEHFKNECKQPAVCVLPTGAGKSVVIAQIASRIGGDILVLQPSKEILEQNVAKYRALGGMATIYSAIVGEKKRSAVTFATIGSVIGERAAFSKFKHVIIDECHVVNAEKGLYQFFLNGQRGAVVIGLTATPYRLNRIGSASVIEFLTRTQPSFFQKVIHVTQQAELRAAGFLSPIVYKRHYEVNTENVIVRGGEYEEGSLKREFRRAKIDDLVIQEIEECKERKAVLVFVEFVEMLEAIKQKMPEIEYVTGATDKIERAAKIERFRSGETRVLVNVGVLTTGFDFPELDTIIVAKATRSLSLWYQIIGRGQRIAQGKVDCLVVDMCDNLRLLGDVQELEIVELGGKWVVKAGRKIITNNSNNDYKGFAKTVRSAQRTIRGYQGADKSPVRRGERL